MAPSPPILSLCSRCLIRRIFPRTSPLLRRQRLVPLLVRHVSSYPAPSHSRPKGRTERHKESKKMRREKDEEIVREGRFLLYEVEGERLSKWTTTVGLEIHAQLNTTRKLFSGVFFFPSPAFLLWWLTGWLARRENLPYRSPKHPHIPLRRFPPWHTTRIQPRRAAPCPACRPGPQLYPR